MKLKYAEGNEYEVVSKFLCRDCGNGIVVRKVPPNPMPEIQQLDYLTTSHGGSGGVVVDHIREFRGRSDKWELTGASIVQAFGRIRKVMYGDVTAIYRDGESIWQRN